MSDLKITIGADITQLQTELAKAGGVTQAFANKTEQSIKTAGNSIFNLTEKLKTLQSSVFTEKDRSKIAAYNQQIKATEVEISKLNALGTGGGFAGLGQAFSGIGAGATKALSALRNIAYVLPGVGIAGILAFATEPIANYISELFGVSAAEKKLHEERKKRVDEYNKAFDSIIDGVAKEATEVVSLIAVLNNHNETRKRQLDALTELKKIQPEIFGNLKLEHGAVVGLSAAYSTYIESLKTVIAAKLIQNEIDEKLTKVLKIQGATNTAEQQKSIDGFRKWADSAQAAKNKLLSDQGISGSGGMTVFQKQDLEVKVLNKDIEDLLVKLTALSKGVDVKETNVSAKKIKITPDKGAQIEVAPGSAGVIDIKAKIAIQDTEAGIGRELNKGRAGAIADKFIGGGVDAVEEELKKKLKELSEKADDLVNSFVADNITSVAAGIGEALAGGSVPNLFGSLIGNVGKQVQDLGKFFISSGLKIKAAKEIFKKFLLSNPLVVVGVGLGLVALGALLQAAAKKQYGFASGSTGTPGGVFDVGERGPYSIFLPQVIKVQPNNELNAYGGGQMVFIPSMTLKGPDIVIAFNRAQQQMNRNN